MNKCFVYFAKIHHVKTLNFNILLRAQSQRTRGTLREHVEFLTKTKEKIPCRDFSSYLLFS